MRFFGKRFDTPAYRECDQASPPAGQPCAHCGEPISPDDDGWLMPHCGPSGIPSDLPYHRECHLRLICGCVEHQMLFGRPCPGTCQDDPNLTMREAAKAAAQLWDHGVFDIRSAKLRGMR